LANGNKIILKTVSYYFSPNDIKFVNYNTYTYSESKAFSGGFNARKLAPPTK
jgi:hypothetical protein